MVSSEILQSEACGEFSDVSLKHVVSTQILQSEACGEYKDITV